MAMQNNKNAKVPAIKRGGDRPVVQTMNHTVEAGDIQTKHDGFLPRAARLQRSRNMGKVTLTDALVPVLPDELLAEIIRYSPSSNILSILLDAHLDTNIKAINQAVPFLAASEKQRVCVNALTDVLGLTRMAQVLLSQTSGVVCSEAVATYLTYTRILPSTLNALLISSKMADNEMSFVSPGNWKTNREPYTEEEMCDHLESTLLQAFEQSRRDFGGVKCRVGATVMFILQFTNSNMITLFKFHLPDGDKAFFEGSDLMLSIADKLTAAIVPYSTDDGSSPIGQIYISPSCIMQSHSNGAMIAPKVTDIIDAVVYVEVRTANGEYYNVSFDHV